MSAARNDSSFKLSMSGNGETYDGKGAYDRNIPGYTCDNQSTPHSQIVSANGKLLLVSNQNGNCGNAGEIPESQLVKSPNVDDYIGYQSGIYARSEMAQAEKQQGIFAEMWCRDLNTSSRRDIIVKWNQVNRTASLQLFDKDIWQTGSGAFSAKRSLQVDVVRYVGFIDGKTVDLRVDNSLKYPDSEYEFRGSLHTDLFGQADQYLVACRKGGEFDAEAAQFHYAGFNQVFALGEPISPLRPVMNKSVAQYSIYPALPSGLQFNSQTGEISGTPTALKAITLYNISAKTTVGTLTTKIYLGVGYKFEVATAADSSDSNPGDGACADSQQMCSLRAAFEEASANSVTPVVVSLPAGTYLLSQGELMLQGSLHLQGDQAVIDAQGLSRHINAGSKSHLHISHVQFVNGLASGPGGSILTTNTKLLIDDSTFSDNRASSADATGGAVSVHDGDVVIHRSEFRNNRVEGNPDGSGGALSITDVEFAQVDSSRFQGNYGPKGGAIYTYAYAMVNVSNCEFTGNTARDGGAILFSLGSNVIEKSKFSNNSAELRGSAIGSWAFHNLWIKDTSFESNRGPSTIYSAANYVGVLRLFEVKFKNNSGGTAVLEQRYFSAVLRGTSFSGNDGMESCRLLSNEYEGKYATGFRDLGGNSFDQLPCPFKK